MTETFKKLNFKGQDPILVLDAPTSFEPDVSVMKGETTVHREPVSFAPARLSYSFAIVFTPKRDRLLANAALILAAAGPDAVLWFAYPKKASKAYASDLDRDLVRETLDPLGIKPVRQIAIDDDWSALRFKGK